MPADPSRINDVNFPAPWEILGRINFHAGKLIREIFRGEFLPVRFEIRDFVGDHLVFLPDGDMDVLKQEISTAEAQAGQTVITPFFDESKFSKEGDGQIEVRAGGHKGIECFSGGVHG